MHIYDPISICRKIYRQVVYDVIIHTVRVMILSNNIAGAIWKSKTKYCNEKMKIFIVYLISLIDRLPFLNFISRKDLTVSGEGSGLL